MNTPANCRTMGSTAAKDKLVASAPFGLGSSGAGNFGGHFGLGAGSRPSVAAVSSADNATSNGNNGETTSANNIGFTNSGYVTTTNTGGITGGICGSGSLIGGGGGSGSEAGASGCDRPPAQPVMQPPEMVTRMPVGGGIGAIIQHLQQQPGSPTVSLKGLSAVGDVSNGYSSPSSAMPYTSSGGGSPGVAPINTASTTTTTTSTPTSTPGTTKRSLIPPKPPPKPMVYRTRDKCGNGNYYRIPLTLTELLYDERFLGHFFNYFSAPERCALAQVCTTWRNVLYTFPQFWRGLVPVMHCRDLRGQWQQQQQLQQQMQQQQPGAVVGLAPRQLFYASLQRRGFEAVCLSGANDEDVSDFLSNCPLAAKHTRRVILRCASVSDKGLEALLDGMPNVYQLELSGCNEVSEAGLWSSLNPRIVSLTISDCINIADESLGAVAQLLPSLYEFNLQAYHVTDAALAYFSPKQSASMSALRLQSCWEISNQGITNVVHALPNLTVLSLAGCSKITDAGVEVIAENLRKLRSLDLAWCPRITDAALEYIACDLTQLEELTLDRCVHVTDIGVGYVSTMLSLNALYLRWCTQIRDFGLQHLCSMRNLQVLSLAGCPLLTAGGLSALIQLRHLQDLELTNCPGASRELFDYLHQHLPHCLVVE